MILYGIIILVNKMKFEKEIFSIISYAGDANRYVFDALDEIENSNYEKAEKLLVEGRKSVNEAHQVQTSLLVNECNSDEESSVPLMMVHAQDHLMNAILLLDLVEKLVSIFKKKEK